MNTRPAPLDFPSAVRAMHAAGAFSDYPSPLGNVKAADIFAPDHAIANPAFPGDSAYAAGGRVILKDGVDLPQEIISAQHHSFSDAIARYLPAEMINQWIHEYFSGDFLNGQGFRRLMVEYQRDPGVFPSASVEPLPDGLTLQLDHAGRRGKGRSYTNKEMQVAQQVARAVPGIALAVLAYQSCFVGYLQRLDEALASADIPDKEKKQASGVVRSLTALWSNPSFLRNIFPAIALHYYKNHSGQISDPPEPATRQDFMQGMVFAVNNGIFANQVPSPGGEVRRLSCPAKNLLTRMSSVDVTKPVSGDKIQVDSMGTGLAHIYEALQPMIEQKKPQAVEALRMISTMVDQSTAPKR